MSKRARAPQQPPPPDPDRALQKAAILTSLARGATRAHACKAAGVPRRTFYNWFHQHHSFRDAVDEAEQQPVAVCEALALRCAMKAESDPRYLRALFHFLKHRAGWGAPARRQPTPFEPDPFDEDDWNGGAPDPDVSLIAPFCAQLEAEALPPWGGMEITALKEAEEDGNETEEEEQKLSPGCPLGERGRTATPGEGPDRQAGDDSNGPWTAEEIEWYGLRDLLTPDEIATAPGRVPPVPSRTAAASRSSRRARAGSQDYLLLPGGVRVPDVPPVSPAETRQSRPTP